MASQIFRHTLRHTLSAKPVVCRRSYSALPRVVSPSFWQTLVPKAFRDQDTSVPSRPVPETKPWNPATFFIVIFLLIGSNAINLLAVKKDYLSFSRQADAKIAALKEAIEKVQRGEEVDVKRLLGTGDAVAEKEWEDVLKELEQERPLEESKRYKRAAAREAAQNKNDVQKTSQFQSEQEEWTKPKGDGSIVRKVEFY